MECMLKAGNAKTFAKAIQSLAKFGTDLFVVLNAAGIMLRTVNNSRTAVGTVKFRVSFFEKFKLKEQNFCKVSMKTCLAVFRDMRQVEHCEIQIRPGESTFYVLLKCFQKETVKKATIPILDDECISDFSDCEKTKNTITGSHKLFTELSANFNMAEEEITFEARIDRVSVTNYIKGSRVNHNFMRSELILSAGEFEQFKIECETTVTFALREFRALLLLAETLNANLTLHFDESGSPLFISLNKHDAIEYVLIMSTLSDDDISFISDDCNGTDIDEHIELDITPTKRRLESPSKTVGAKTRKSIAENSTLSNIDSQLFQFNSATTCDSHNINGHTLAMPRNLRSYALPSTPPNQELGINACIGNITNSISQLQSNESALASVDKTTIGVGGDECVPESPQEPRQWHEVRSIFSRCFELTYQAIEPSASSEFYVANSDVETD